MNFDICKRENDKEYFVIDLSEDCLDNIKKNLTNINYLEIDAKALNLGICLYGKTKKESIEIQKKNCKQMLELYAVCVKVIRLFKCKKIAFDGKFYTSGLDEKKNNNDYMLKSMLDVKFNVGLFKKLSASYSYVADYLDMENTLNKMCDFRGNQCAKHRLVKSDKTSGCCPKNHCKYTCSAPCPVWNLACKIMMCDYLIENKGFYFTPHTIPLMRKQFSIFERCFSIGQLCRSRKKAIVELWLFRAGGLFVFLMVLGVVALLFI